MTLKKLQQAAWKDMVQNTNEAKPYFFALGIVLIVAYMGFYFFNTHVATPNSEESLLLRLSISSLGLVLIGYKYTNRFISKFEPIFFYFTLIYTLPFFFSYMLLQNQDSNIWQINGLMGFILLTFFVDWLSCIVLSLIGFALAYLVTYFTIKDFSLGSHLIAVLVSYSSPILYCIIFSYKRKAITDQQNYQHSKIKESNEELEDEVEERTAQLEKALAVKTEFLNNMSHEIRTPIQGMSAISQGLVEHWEEFTENKRFKLASQISLSAARLYALIGHLLDLSKFSAGKMLLDLKKNDLAKITKEIIKECKMLYLHEKKIKFEFEAAEENLFIGDSERIRQVLRNIFANAIKFSATKTTIFVKIKKSQITYDNGNVTEALHLSVTDQGIGIPEAEIELIFNPFTQSSKTKTKAGGTGLGLTICQEIISAHKGKIWAENNQDEGATFSFLIPVTPNKEMLQSKIIAEGEQKPDSIQEIAKDKTITILVVDDEEVCLTSMELFLHNTACKLIKANGGGKALEELKHNKIDLVFLDLMMPDMYGLNVLQEMKKDPELSNIPVILQSGTSDEAEIEKAYDMGISAYIKKPYNKQAIISELSKTIANIKAA